MNVLGSFFLLVDSSILCGFREIILILWTQDQVIVNSKVDVSSSCGLEMKDLHRNQTFCGFKD
ncbi:unnamed protein product [Spirodela intermedia]|uniref:Uncharacterized protein n=1 Tax=Spirodela intermedia TaxID=51605 RepID=A0A7I8IV18_SPIIN|nr:unnamed protein product [Spirodela intermedia]CAA6661413.1 unnamed protein product [Spirodela intermedia]